MSVYAELAELLAQVTESLQAAGLWEGQSPPVEALASTEPFAVDQLSFSQWLQFIFLPRINKIVDAETPLPESCSIAPMAEEFFKAEPNIDSEKSAAMVAHLAAIDQLITQN